ncbi:hypothetical protein JT358_03655 [Micrococcales bacterium 31B]|nr:hypothetical protein [Micrococcales bacterium 31B]
MALVAAPLAASATPPASPSASGSPSASATTPASPSASATPPPARTSREVALKEWRTQVEAMGYTVQDMPAAQMPARPDPGAWTPPPATSRALDDAAAISAAEAFVQAYSYFHVTLDPWPMQSRALLGCTTCDSLRAVQDSYTKFRGYSIGAPLTITDPEVADSSETGRTVIATVHYPAQDVYLPELNLHLRSPEATGEWLFFYSTADGAQGWYLAEVRRNS